ncbi:hypothetical protein K2173_021895 [Erythroxylum novogranatense]|uniref:Exocyst component Exo84 C-terminal domain-containing protein n=1 Tax=Erythroxylum novogranatense TaxID=1862640 RepID=A0AAV8T278_9ROSI|nr:hypothetical protein K2173_021895 [Erythroxylum novogranatense]
MPRTLSIGDDLEENLSLSDRLKAFKSSSFDPDAYVASKCQTINEKEIKHLYSGLNELKRASAEEMRKCVYANYAAFIRTSKEISDLEVQLLSMRNHLSNQAALVHGLSERVRIDSLWAEGDDSLEEDLSKSEVQKLCAEEDWVYKLLDALETLLADRRVDEVMSTVEKGEGILREADKFSLSPTGFTLLQNAVREKREKLSEQLADTISQTRGSELRSAVMALKKLGDGPRAHTLLLNSHHRKLQSNMQALRSSKVAYAGSYTAALSQLVFSTIAQAARDSLAAFGEETSYASEFVTWAVKQTEIFALILKRHVLASSAASGGLRVAAECIQISFGHCSLLEARGLSLSPVLLRHFKTCIEQALSANLKKIERTSAALAAADDWSVSYQPVSGRTSIAPVANTMASLPKLSSSANRFNSMVQELLDDVGPLESLQLEGPALEGVLQVFNNYVNLLIHALPGSVEHEEHLEGSGHKIVRTAENEAQQIALLANASSLAEELLPRAAMKLLPLPGRMDEHPRRSSDKQYRLPDHREWKKKLQRSTDRLRDSFCRQHALELIFTEDGEIRLNSHIYTSMDDHTEEPDWFPSPIFQELFAKLTRMASIATDMFVGRERFATVLLMRLTETVILWLSDDQTFWEEIEAGPKPLGPLGLQQLYLDMEFVLLFASQGRYLSRHLHQVIKDIIGKAIEVLSASGVDPYSVLPEDDWFAEVAQTAISILSGKTNFDDVERDVTSPTASVSAISHGSN